jgi:two-component system CheB/CheR fusion protein
MTKILSNHSVDFSNQMRGASVVLMYARPPVSGRRVPIEENAMQTMMNIAERGQRILLVEDHVDTAMVLRLLMQRYGFHVEVAQTVAAALEVYAPERFDVIVCDIGLPDGSGLDLLKKFREQGPVRAIALTGYGMESDIIESMNAGFAEHMLKPVSAEDLRRAVMRVLAEVQFRRAS